MTVDSFTVIWNRVLLRCPSASAFLAQDWVRNAFRQIAERRRWSWLVKYGQFLVPAVYNTGTVSLTRSSATVTGSGTTFTSAMVGRQFRIGTGTPIYTISAYTSATSITLDSVWGGSTVSGSAYSIYQCYFTPATDFHSFISVFDPAMNWQLWLNVQQEELNLWDAQRANMGQSYVVSAYDYGSGIIPRYEIWPHQQAQYVFPYIYEARAQDLDESGAVLPSFIRGDVLLEMALAEAARWPGPSADKPNPYKDLNLAILHERRAEKMITEMETQDDATYEADVTFTYPAMGWPWASPLGDSAYLQSHAL